MIKNVIVFNDLSNSTDFTFNVGPFTLNPDVCMVRSISYSGEADDIQGNYMIWSDITNDYIASFAIENKSINAADGETVPVVNLNPQSILLIKQAMMNSSERKFKIYHVAQGNKVVNPVTYQLFGELSITLEFITYKKISH